MRKLKDYTPTQFMAENSHYDKAAADYAVRFIECLAHTKGTWAGKPFELIDWQERIIRDLFGVLKPNGYRQFNTAYIEIPKKNGKSELAAAVALLLTCGDGEERAEVYGCAADRQQAAIVFDVAADMVRMCPALNKRVKILTSQKRIIYTPTNSFYQGLSAEAYSKHGFNIHGVVFDELHTQYYIEDDHEAIIPKDIFMRVQEEMARRSSERDMNGRRQGFSANHAFSHIVTCECCGEHFRRLHWNNRGKKTIVWRCKTRLEDKTRCSARTVSEDTLQEAFVEAINEMLGNSDEYLKKLESNLKTAIHLANPQSAEALAERMRQLQQELIDRTESGENYDELAEEILHLRELQEQTAMDDTARVAHRERIQELLHFIHSQPRTITEFDEVLVKKLLEGVRVGETYLEFQFKSGARIVIENE